MTTADPDSSLEALARSVRRLEARAAIQDLVTRYAVACDLRDYAALGECFDEEGSFDSVGGTIVGRDALVAYYRERFAIYGPTYHVPHSIAVSWDPQDDDRAEGTVLAHSEIFFDQQFVVAAHHYHDRYRRGRDGVWRLLSRDVDFLYAMPLSELAHADWQQHRRRFPGAEPMPADIPEKSPHWTPPPWAV